MIIRALGVVLALMVVLSFCARMPCLVAIGLMARANTMSGSVLAATAAAPPSSSALRVCTLASVEPPISASAAASGVRPLSGAVAGVDLGGGTQ